MGQGIGPLITIPKTLTASRRDRQRRIPAARTSLNHFLSGVPAARLLEANHNYVGRENRVRDKAPYLPCPVGLHSNYSHIFAGVFIKVRKSSVPSTPKLGPFNSRRHCLLSGLELAALLLILSVILCCCRGARCVPAPTPDVQACWRCNDPTDRRSKDHESLPPTLPKR